MKRLFCCLLLLCLLLSGCGMLGEHVKEPVTFYYIQSDYRKDMEPVIGSEIREASGHREDLNYLLALYSLGPSEKELKSLLPRNCTILPIERSTDSIVLSLSENAGTLKDADFTQASACIALTCMELTGVEQVTVVCQERSVTIREDNLLFSSLPTTQEETT